MRQQVIDLATGKMEWIDFVPVSTLTSQPFTAHSYDNQLTRPLDYKDHTRPNYPMPATVFANLDVIHSVDASDSSPTLRPILSDLNAPCSLIPQGFRRNGQFCSDLLRAYKAKTKKGDELDAIRQLQSCHDRLNRFGYSFAMADDDIQRLADAKSRQFARKIQAVVGIEKQFDLTVSLLDSLGLSFRPDMIDHAKENHELFALINRAVDANWLARQLRRKCAYEVEQVARDMAIVQKSKQPYCSDFSVMRHRDRRQSNRDALENTVCYEDENPQNWFTVKELSDKSVSNTSLRRAEMFARLNGFEEIAKESGHEAMFYTSTAPSRFHAVSKGQANQKWIEAGRPDAKQTHEYLMNVWQQLGRVLAKKDIKLYGIRIVEPHQDGTPHHHMLLFMHKKHRKTVTQEFKRLCLTDTPDEKGAKKFRFKAERIDFSKGSAVGYVAKYLSKNIDGQHIENDRGTDLEGIDAAERVVTWARVNQIRQFQFIGGPSVTVWREMRRLREEFKEDDAVFTHLDDEEKYLLESVRRAADAGDWKAFCYAMGGVLVKRDQFTVRTHYTVADAVEKLIDTGEYTPTQYGDHAAARVNGLMFKQVFLATRFKNWKVENKEQFLKAQKGIMTNVVDYFDALEREKEYQRMAEERYEQYQAYVEQCEELQSLVMTASPEEIAACASDIVRPHWM